MKRAFLSVLTAAILTLLLSTCLSDWSGEETGTITFNIGRGNAKAAWPPTEANGLLQQLEHQVILTSSTGKITRTIPKGVVSGNISVLPATYTIKVEALIGGALYATGNGLDSSGSNSITVTAGQSTPVTVAMSEENPGVTYLIVSKNDEWNDAVDYINNPLNTGPYFIFFTGNITINSPGIANTFTGAVSVTIIGKKSITQSSSGSLFTIGTGQRLSLQDTVLVGLSTEGGASQDNEYPLVLVNAGGTFIMSGASKVTGNTNTSIAGTTNTFGGGVRVSGAGSSFTMNDTAQVSGNKTTGGGTNGGGAGVRVETGGSFYMTDNAIVTKNTSGVARARSSCCKAYSRAGRSRTTRCAATSSG
jgi:hypothetical protein